MHKNSLTHIKPAFTVDFKRKNRQCRIFAHTCIEIKSTTSYRPFALQTFRAISGIFKVNLEICTYTHGKKSSIFSLCVMLKSYAGDLSVSIFSRQTCCLLATSRSVLRRTTSSGCVAAGSTSDSARDTLGPVARRQRSQTRC